MPFAGRTIDGRPLVWLQRLEDTSSTLTSTSISGSGVRLHATTLSAQAITISRPFQLFDTVPFPFISSPTVSTSVITSSLSEASPSVNIPYGSRGGRDSTKGSNDSTKTRCSVTCSSYDYYRLRHDHGEASHAHQLFLSPHSARSGITTSSTFDFLYKFLLVGDPGAGRSAMVNRFYDDNFTSTLQSFFSIIYNRSTNEVCHYHGQVNLQVQYRLSSGFEPCIMMDILLNYRCAAV
jgi:hypothetical protein